MFPNDEPSDPVTSQPSAEAAAIETEDKVNEARDDVGVQPSAAGEHSGIAAVALETSLIAGFLAISPRGVMHAFRVEAGFSPDVVIHDLNERLAKPGNDQVGYAVYVDAYGARLGPPLARPVTRE